MPNNAANRSVLYSLAQTAVKMIKWIKHHSLRTAKEAWGDKERQSEMN